MLPVAIVLAAILWLLAEFAADSLLQWQTLGGLAAIAFIAYSLIEVNAVHSFIRTGTSFHTSVFLIFFTSVPALYVQGITFLVPCLFMLQIGMLFGSFENPYASTPVFNSFLSLGLITLIQPYFLLLVPVVYLQLGYLRSFSLRTFLAGIMGLSLPYWLLWGYAAYSGDYSYLILKLQGLVSFSHIDFSHLGIEQCLTYVFFFLLSVISGFHTYDSSYKEKVHTRLMLHVVVIMEIFVNLMLIFQPQHFNVLMSVLVILCSITSGYMFSVKFTPFTRVFIYFVLILWLVVLIFNLWTLFNLF